MEFVGERKQRYYDWHGADLGTLGELELELAKNPEVLDLGCGTGWLTSRMAESGAQSVVGVDVDSGAIATLNSCAGPKEKGICASSDALPFADASFDLVVAKDLLEHMPNPARTVDEIYRVLRVGGALYISTPSPMSRHFWDDYTHIRPFTARAVRSMFEDVGFQTERLYYTGNYPGIGKYMRLMGKNRLPKIVHILAGWGIMRNNVHAWGRKI